MLGPILRGRYVTLAPLKPEHLPAYLDWFADLEVTLHLKVTTPLTMAAEEAWYRRMAASENDILWAIKWDDKEHVGSAALHRINWRDRHAMGGIVIGNKDFWRRGVATEVMQMRTKYAFLFLNLEKVMTEIDVANEGSWRAAMKGGYKQCGLRRRHRFRNGRWQDVWLGEVLRDEWLQAQAQAARQQPGV